MSALRRFPTIVMLISGIAAAPMARAEDPVTFESVLAMVEKTVKSMEAITADIELMVKMMGIEAKMSGPMQMQGEKLRVKLDAEMMGQKMTMTQVHPGDGMMWSEVEMMGQKMVVKGEREDVAEIEAQKAGFFILAEDDPVAMFRDPVGMLKGLAELFDMQYGGTAERDGLEVYVLEGKAKAKPEVPGGSEAETFNLIDSMTAIRYEVGKTDGFARSMSIMGPDDAALMTMAYKNVNLDPKALDPAAFTYSPPEGVPVMDLKEMMAQKAEANQSVEVAPAQEEAPAPKFKVGDVAGEFEGTTLDGKTVKLSGYKGKVVMVDFWATWCGPCVEEMPNVIAAYGKYHAKGFEILAVSLDDEKPALEKFLGENPKMTWTQLFDGKGWETPVALQYEIEAIPATLLLDKDGKVVAVDLRGEQLAEQLAKMLE